MAPAAVASVDLRASFTDVLLETSEMLEKMKLEAKSRGVSDAAKKQSNGVSGQLPPYRRSTTPMQKEYLDPLICSPYYYGGYETPEWSEYFRMFNQGVDPAGVYGENGQLMYPQSYGYAPYPYSPATSPGPVLDSHQSYQYPAYNSSLTANGAPFTPSLTTTKHAIISEVTANEKKKPLPSDSINVGGLILNNNQMISKTTQTNPAGKGAVENGSAPLVGYQDTRYSYDSSRLPGWVDSQPTKCASSGKTASNSQMLRPQNHPMSGNGVNNSFMNRIFCSPAHLGYGYIPGGYNSRINGQGWIPMDARYKTGGQGNGFYGYGNENSDGLNELNRGPRGNKNIKGLTPVVKNQNEVAKEAIVDNIVNELPHAEQYNSPDFAVDYSDAKFFIIKSYSEDDVHKSVKYNVWASTPNGNKKLDAAYQQARAKSGPCPVFLFFSVNASGQFVGLAEMVSSVDFDISLEYWQQDKWNGCFSLKWHIVKDVPNTLLKHIILENNENKPVTNSRDTQEVKLEQGLQMLRIFKDHTSRTSILDDFTFYETRQKAIQEKKVRLQFRKQVWEGDLKNQDASKDEFPEVHANGYQR